MGKLSDTVCEDYISVQCHQLSTTLDDSPGMGEDPLKLEIGVAMFYLFLIWSKRKTDVFVYRNYFYRMITQVLPSSVIKILYRSNPPDSMICHH